MATQVHCAYCFETLFATLEKRTTPTLRQVELLWDKYYNQQNSKDTLESLQDAESMYKPAAISRLLVASPSTTSSSSIQSVGSTPGGSSEASSATSKSSSRSDLFSKTHKADDDTDEDHPLFITWNTITKSGDKRLRGCIGTFEPQELDEGLKSYALTSALHDTRFSPITARELPTLECGVTLLTDFEPASSPLDWTIGTHGLRISFTYHNRRYGATYLPDVAREQGWTKEETLISLMRKAGWTGRKDEWQKVELGVVRYQGKKVALSYEDWKEWRDSVEDELDDA